MVSLFLMIHHDAKIIVFTAPSGSGKTTIAKAVMEQFPQLAFSVSATTRPKRDHEINGVDYFFLTPEDFREKIGNDEFFEWEEVYPGRFYGTLKSEVDRLLGEGKIPLLDLDVKGAVTVKKYFGTHAMTAFIKVPLDELVDRLRKRGTETEETLKTRRDRFAFELSFEDQFDVTVNNDDLSHAISQACVIVKDFLSL